MKKIIISIVLAASLIIPAPAQAAETKFAGGPLTNLDSTAASIHIALSNFPVKGGLYIQECVQAPSGIRPALCNKAADLWISTDKNASFAPTADIVFKPTGVFTTGATTVDCTVSKCGIFLRFDHTLPADLSEDQFIPLTFKTGAATSPTIPADEITATINGVALSTKTAIKLEYRAPAVLAAVSKTGAVLTYASLAPACALSGMEITALKGSGFCDIAITSAGTAMAGSVTFHFPIELNLGTQNLGNFQMPTTLARGKKIATTSVTNFGAKITYKTSGACSVSNGSISVNKGLCKVVISAPGSPGLWKPLKASYSIKSK